MTAEEIMEWLATHGSAQTKKVLMRHGAQEPFFGVKISDLKIVLKSHKNNQTLAEQLWRSGNSDAMYLAALMANKDTVTPQTLRAWMNDAYWCLLSESAVAGLAAESAYGWDLGLEWIESESEMIAAGGWATLSLCISLQPDSALDIACIKRHLPHIARVIHSERNRVRYAMNSYVIHAAAYIRELYATATQIAKQIGAVSVDVGETSCKTPLALDYIQKIKARGALGKKRTYARC